MKADTKKAFKLAGIVFLLYLCIHYWNSFAKFLNHTFDAAFPVILGCIVAYLINILMSFYERHYFPHKKNKAVIKTRKPICLIGAIITMIAIVSLVVSLIIPQLILCIQVVAKEIPGVIEKIIALDGNFKIIPDNVISFLTSVDWKSMLDKITKLLSLGFTNVMGGVVNVVSSVFSGVVTSVLGIVFAIYLLLGKDVLLRQTNKFAETYIKESVLGKIRYVLSVLNDSFHRFIVGQCAEAVILGFLCSFGMMILQLPYATMIGALVAFTALIPIVGAFIGAIVGAFMILTVSPIKALVFIIFLIILQQLEENLIYPKVVGSSIGLPAIWVLAAVTIGGGIMGITGMLIGVPITAAIYRIIKHDIKKKTIKEEPSDEHNEQTEE